MEWQSEWGFVKCFNDNIFLILVYSALSAFSISMWYSFSNIFLFCYLLCHLVLYFDIRMAKFGLLLSSAGVANGLTGRRLVWCVFLGTCLIETRYGL